VGHVAWQPAAEWGLNIALGQVMAGQGAVPLHGS